MSVSQKDRQGVSYECGVKCYEYSFNSFYHTPTIGIPPAWWQLSASPPKQNLKLKSWPDFPITQNAPPKHRILFSEAQWGSALVHFYFATLASALPPTEPRRMVGNLYWVTQLNCPALGIWLSLANNS